MTEQSSSSSLFGTFLRRFVFWEYRRASWQYDVIVALILVFIFATPRDWFRDQPRAAGIVILSADRGNQRVYIDGSLLADIPEGGREARAAALIHQKTGVSRHVLRVEPIRDEAEGEIKGYIAYTAP